jgi:hypothetical protein
MLKNLKSLSLRSILSLRNIVSSLSNNLGLNVFLSHLIYFLKLSLKHFKALMTKFHQKDLLQLYSNLSLGKQMVSLNPNIHHKVIKITRELDTNIF